MKLLRLRLTNYRGIGESIVQFRPNGLTIVEGPNEVGKTCLREAIGILFDYLDSSKHRCVEALKPVHLDAGPEIELEAESGPYGFIYFKRFLKRPETTLAVKKPRNENHTGREAHERADEILRETIDVDLWKALCIPQGEGIQQADLSKQTSLSAALDVAAGGQRGDPREESLFDKVREEYGRYFTERGTEKKELQASNNSKRQSETELACLEQKIQELEKDINRAADLDQELVQLKKQEQILREDVSKYSRSLDEIKNLEDILKTACLKLESARKSEQEARQKREDRKNLIDTVTRVRKEYAELVVSHSSTTTCLNTADEDMTAAQSASDKAEKQRKAAESLLRLRREDFDYFNNKLHLEQMQERKSRIDNARKEAALAEELLLKNSVDEEVLETIQQAERTLITAQAKLEAGAPNVRLRGLANLHLQIDGRQVSILKDEEQNFSVPDRIRVSIPDAMDIEVTAGSSASKLSKAVEESRRKLDEACKDSGVGDPNEARIAYDARRDALRRIEDRNRIESENLRDLTYDQLEKKVMGLEMSVPAYPLTRVQDPRIAPNLESAKKEQQNAEAILEKANEDWEEARSALDIARKVRDELREQYQEVKVKLDLKATELKQAEDSLIHSRENSSDDNLELELKQCARIVESVEEEVRSAETTLLSKEPEQVRTLAETAQGSLQTAVEKRESVKEENIEVRASLKFRGEEGLHDKLNAAQSALEHIQRENEAIMRRASAAKLLYVTMKEERDRARLAYVAPLKERIEKLGRLVFNHSFEVEVTEDLLIANRTLNGVSVPFDSLSGGAKEQLSLISRLACAMTVSKDGGGSLILDDALGYTDPERLKLMGAVLAKAGRECQIVVLTCVPERYSNVGEATVVRLG